MAEPFRGGMLKRVGTSVLSPSSFCSAQEPLRSHYISRVFLKRHRIGGSWLNCLRIGLSRLSDPWVCGATGLGLCTLSRKKWYRGGDGYRRPSLPCCSYPAPGSTLHGRCS